MKALLFAAAYAGATAAFLPASPLTLAAGAAFGLKLGFLVCWAGATAGACLGFLVSRYALRDRVARRFAGRPAFHAVSKAVAAEGWKVVLLTRLSPVFPFTALNYAFGLTEARFGEYALATAVGILPGTFLYVSLGAAAGEAAKGRARGAAEWALLAAGLAATAAVVWLVGRRAKALLAAS